MAGIERCPFCGKDTGYTGAKRPVGARLAYRVLCVNCGASGGRRGTRDAAIAAWNMRPGLLAAACRKNKAETEKGSPLAKKRGKK